jgi:hypothetical protein
MFTLGKRSYTLNFNDTEISEMLEFLSSLQEKSGIELKTPKDLVLHLVRNQTDESGVILGPDQRVIDFPPTMAMKTEEFRTLSEMSSEDPIEKVLAYALLTALTPAIESPAPIVEEPTKVPAPTPEALPDNIIQFEISPNEEKLIDHIREYRANYFKTEIISRSRQAYELAFNQATLGNWGGQYRTGL